MRRDFDRPTSNAVTLAGKPLQHRVETRDGRLAIVLAQAVTLTTGQTLKVIV